MLERTPIHASLTTPILLLGCERSTLISLAILSGGLMLGGGLHLISWAYSIGLLAIGIPALREATKVHPKISKVYLRFSAHPAYYVPRAPVSDKPYARIHPSIPTRRDISGFHIW